MDSGPACSKKYIIVIPVLIFLFVFTGAYTGKASPTAHSTDWNV